MKAAAAPADPPDPSHVTELPQLEDPFVCADAVGVAWDVEAKAGAAVAFPALPQAPIVVWDPERAVFRQAMRL